MGRKYVFAAVAATALTAATFSCSKATDTAVVTPSRGLYIASGQCNSGLGITTYSSSTSSRLVSKVNLSSGAMSFFLDLSSPYQGGNLLQETSPQSLVDDGANVLMLTENATIAGTGERRIFTIPKASPYNMSIYSTDYNALTPTPAHITRALAKNVDGTLLFSKSVSIEKIGTNSLRIPMGANAWVNAPAAPCSSSATLMSSVIALPPFSPATVGKVLFAHNDTVAANNRMGIVSQDGYSVAADCTGGVQVSGVAHTYASNVTGPLPIIFAAGGVNVTSMIYISTGTGTGKVIASYSAATAAELNNNANLNYAIVMWDVTEASTTLSTLTNPVVLYRDFSTIFGVSAMAYDDTTGVLYVATASQPGVANQTTSGYAYKVEKFTLNITTPSLTLVQVNNKPFVERSSATKCISSMIVAE